MTERQRNPQRQPSGRFLRIRVISLRDFRLRLSERLLASYYRLLFRYFNIRKPLQSTL
ncbi:hypothetical protein D3C84_1192110 [compost metagenome]